MSEKPITRTELSELGEFGLIDHLTRNISLYQPGTIKGVGDDCAVIDAGDHFLLATTDLLIEGIHFDLTYTPLKHLGYKAVAVNLSDIAAMNGKTTHIMIGLSVSNRFSVEALSELYEGILIACNKFKVDLVGGDTTTSPSGMFISVTALGTVGKDEVCYRNKASENDLVCVSGDLGASYMGLLLLEREKAVFKDDRNMQPDLSGNEYIVKRQLKPEPRFDVIEAFRKAGVKPTSMIDISDGLASEILHLCTGSKTGCRLYEEKLPIDINTAHMAEEFGISPTTAALNGGEDYELLFTVGLNDFEKVKTIPGISIIGHMREKEDGIHLVTSGGNLVQIKAQGWNHMK